AHDASCAARDYRWCLAHWFDVYDVHGVCLIHAVLREDWDQIRKAEKGLPYGREATTADGRWIDAPLPSPRFQYATVTAQQFIVAGGAKTEDETIAMHRKYRRQW